jgi:hypothetical protein
MRKYFEDHSFTGVVLIICSFVFAVFLRVFDLGSLSPWTDELASWFYLRHLDVVFKVESHTPFYYGVLRVILGGDATLYSIRLFSALLSVAHLLTAFFLGRKVFSPDKFLIFWFLICFNPTDIVFARMARHYSWLLEGTLLYVLWVRVKAPNWWLCVFSVIMVFIHVFSLIPISMILTWDYLKERDLKRFILPLASSGVIVFYYLLRVILLGPKQVAINVSWNASTFSYFLNSTWLQLFGESYPRHLFFPVSLLFACAISVLIGLFLVWKRKKSTLLLLSTIVLTIIVVETLNLGWLNLRLNRYVIYLVPLLIFALVDSFDERVSKPAILFVFILCLSYITSFNPLRVYPWDREKVALWKEFSRLQPGTAQFICSNSYQAAYFDMKDNYPCSQRVLDINPKAPVLFFDLNSNDRLVLIYLMQQMNLKEIFGPATNGIYLFEPR